MGAGAWVHAGCDADLDAGSRGYTDADLDARSADYTYADLDARSRGYADADGHHVER